MALTDGCDATDEGWIFIFSKSRYVYCGFCGVNYTKFENTTIISGKVVLNDANKDTDWELLIEREPSFGGYYDRMYVTAPNKNKIFVGETVYSDRLDIDDRLHRETLISYDFIYCGDIYCCCCPAEMSLPKILESKLK